MLPGNDIVICWIKTTYLCLQNKKLVNMNTVSGWMNEVKQNGNSANLLKSKTKLKCNISWHQFTSCVVSWASKNDNVHMTSPRFLHSSHVCWLCPVIGQISSLQATQMTQEAAIRDLDNERNRLKDKVLRMEEERESLQSQCQALDERQKQQLQSLEKVCVWLLVVWCIYFRLE